MHARTGEKHHFASLLKQIRNIVRTSRRRDDALLAVCRLLKDSVPHYDWVGFYLREPADGRTLVLGPYVGAPTEHTRIAFGQGICGQAAAREETFVVQDVSEEANYLSCSAAVRAEIVVPVFAGGAVAGELDIDSHALAPFTEEDRSFLEAVSEAVSELFERRRDATGAARDG